MEPSPILEIAARILAAAVAVVLVCVRLRIPVVAGLLVAGALIGPTGLGWVPDSTDVERFAEIGVVLLLFVIGLEFSRDRLRELGRTLAIGGPLQTGLTIALAATVALSFDLPPRTALVVGLIVCLSSTALVLKLYDDREELASLHGRAVFGILIFQDFLVVPLFVLVPALGDGAAGGLSGLAALAGRVAAGIAVLAIAVLLGRRVVPRLLGLAARGSGSGPFLLVAVAACLGLAWVSERLGLSAALGAFLAGFLLADTQYAHQTVAEVLPLRELFASLFFVSVGMLVDLSFVARQPGTVLAAAAAVVAIKAFAGGAAVRALGLPRRTALLAALGLAQIGEFSFVLLEMGRQARLLERDQYQLLLAVAALTMLATPLLVAGAPALAERLRFAPDGPLAELPSGPPRRGQVLIAGYGENGRILARILRESGISYTIVDADSERVRRGTAAGEPIVFGDATRAEILEHAGVREARVVVLALSDVRAVRTAVGRIRALAPAAQILVRTRRLRHVEALERVGADRVVAEEYEAAIEVYTWVLERMHVPRNVIVAYTKVLRGEDYALLRAAGTPTAASRAIAEALATGTTDIFRIGEGSAVVGKTLAELDLRRRSGAAVIALVRGEKPDLAPSPECRLEAGDQLVLVGAHVEIESAFDLLDAHA